MISEFEIILREIYNPILYFFYNTIIPFLNIKALFLLFVLSPLLGFIINFFGSRYFTKFQSGLIAVGFLVLSCFGSYVLFLPFLFLDSSILFEYSGWIRYDFFILNWTFLIDPLSSFMLIVITTVSLVVHIYSYEYMNTDPNLGRFLSFLNLFTFFMIMLVVAGNFVQLFIGWEGVGLSSYLLINFWYTRLEANKSALKAIVMNRIGDCALLIAITMAYYYFGTFDFVTIFQLLPEFLIRKIQIFGIEFDLVTTFGFFILIGAFAKSAQLGLHTWLPDAMEGPTPVSALLHAATMVTAGVYLVTRFSFVFENSEILLDFCMIFGALTALFGSTVALVQVDLKKIIAFSTCSQLGYMFVACGASAYNVAMYHLMTHASFKALLFLGAGAIIHVLNNEQDIRRMGGLINFMPLIFISMFIGFSSLMGFPFLSGFYSKDLILEVCFSTSKIYGSLAFILCLIGVFFTALYSFRALFYVFWSKPNFTNYWSKNLNKLHDLSLNMFISLLPLVLGSIFLGFFIKDFTVGLGTTFWQSSIQLNFANLTFVDAEFISIYIKLLPTFTVFFGLAFGYLIYYYKNLQLYNILFTSNFMKTLLYFLAKKWYFDVIYNKFIVSFFFSTAYKNVFRDLDRGAFEYFGPFGGLFTIAMIAKLFSRIQSGGLAHYGFFLIFGFIILINLILIYHLLFD